MPRRSLALAIALASGLGPGFAQVTRRGLLASFLAPAPAAAAVPAARPATKDELLEIAGAFAQLATTPNTPGADAVFAEVEETLGKAIVKWESGTITAPALIEEKARLRLGRARARVVFNDLLSGTRPDKVEGAIEDYDAGIAIMEDDLKQHPDRLMYSEYPDALVKRGLAKEGLRNWRGAVEDYSQAIEALKPKDGRRDKALRGDARMQEGDGLGANPLILNFRGNALAQLGRFDEAVEDYVEATQIFDADGEVRQASLSRANAGLALFGAGRDIEAIRFMEQVVRNDPGVTDAHVALAAWYWSNARPAEAESQWQFACDQISTGCQAYKDMKWLKEVRRWPPSLVSSLQDFLAKVSSHYHQLRLAEKAAELKPEEEGQHTIFAAWTEAQIGTLASLEPHHAMSQVHFAPAFLRPTAMGKIMPLPAQYSSWAAYLPRTSGTPDEKEANASLSDFVGSQVTGHVWQLSLRQRGSRAVQDAIDLCSSDQEREAIAGELAGHIWEAVRCPHANFVVQRLITALRPAACQFIIDEIMRPGSKSVGYLARHKYGCRTLQRLLEKCSQQQTLPIVEGLLSEVVPLSRHPYGNYVVQQLFEHASSQHRSSAVQKLLRNVALVGADCNGGAVLLKAMTNASPEEKAQLAHALATEPGLILSIARGRYGHAVARFD
ncbi:unnamed protein product [Effrenium voratum]|uniref:PUM-HD domain-containing protein n=1 Tax=Effrenium voratum TaxID=2562239 RepID=A0AA36NDZ4_9DINO|nr:unnamed protein product [Effrenium voratum]